MADRPYRIVVTGGPGGGKTTAADLFRREMAGKVAVVPEAATILFGGGFPRGGPAQRAAQVAIYQVQRNLEDARTKVQKLVERAMKAPRPRRLTQPSRGAVERRLRQKRARSSVKRARLTAADDEA